jgi:hypothetical protein
MTYKPPGFRGFVPGTAAAVAADSQAQRQKADETDPTDPNFRLQQLRARAQQTTAAMRYSAMTISAATRVWQRERLRESSQSR